MLWALVMAGGRGTRLWPLSHQKAPKPFLHLVPGRKTLFEETIHRLQPLISKKQIWVIGNRDHLSLMRKYSSGVPRRQIIGEPLGRNTAPAVALCASQIARIDPEAVLLVLPADHWIHNEKKFRRSIRDAFQFSKKHRAFVIFGVPPTFPSTAYGYLNRGRKTSGSIYHLNRFVEKPDLKRAKLFFRSKTYFWHAGIFAAPVRVILEEMDRLTPRLMGSIKTVRVQKGVFSPEKIFRKLPDISIDYAVLEKLSNAYMLTGGFDWCDVGTWSSFQGLWPYDEAKNAGFGPYLSLESSGNTVYTKEKPVCLFDVHDLVVVNTPEAVLVTHKGCGESIRHLVRMFHRRAGTKKRARPA